MKEMLKSKMMIGFIVFVLGCSYFNSVGISNVNNFENATDKEIVMNVK